MNTNNWKLDLFSALDSANSIQSVMDASVAAVRLFGFDFCAWRLASEQALYGQHISINSSNDRAHYTECAREYDDTPCSRHCARSSVPFIWLGTTHDAVFNQDPELFEEYYSFGHYGGWAKSIMPEGECYNMFYAESAQPFKSIDIQHVEQHMEWICAATYVRIHELPSEDTVTLTDEKRQVLLLYVKGCRNIEEISGVVCRPTYWVNAVLTSAIKLLKCCDINMAIARAIFLKLI